MLEGGIIDHLYDSYLVNGTKCLSRGNFQKSRVLALKDFYGIYAMLFTGIYNKYKDQSNL